MTELKLVEKLHADIVEELRGKLNGDLEGTAWKVVYHVLEYHSDACGLVLKTVKICNCSKHVPHPIP